MTRGWGGVTYIRTYRRLSRVFTPNHLPTSRAYLGADLVATLAGLEVNYFPHGYVADWCDGRLTVLHGAAPLKLRPQ